MAAAPRIDFRDVWVTGPIVAIAVAVLALIPSLIIRAHREVPTFTPPAGVVASSVSGPTRTTAYFLGDSYTAGVGSTTEAGYVDQVARALDWSVVRDGQPSTGYTTAGEQGGERFADRAQEVVALHPDVVIVQGGLFDAGSVAASAVAANLLEYLRAGLPDAQIVAVGPTDPPAGSVRQIAAVSAAIEMAAETADVAFVDPLDEEWLTSQDYADGTHPSDDGYRTYADRLTADLQALVRP